MNAFDHVHVLSAPLLGSSRLARRNDTQLNRKRRILGLQKLRDLADGPNVRHGYENDRNIDIS